MAKIQVRRGTSAQWASANPVLAVGEPGRDTSLKRSKTGDGVSAWSALPWDAPSKAELDNSYVPLFQPLTAYLAGALAVLPAPTNALGTRITDGTSRAAFDATEQALWATAAGGYDGGTL